jgi:prepilin-type N-terminal cleavage/methylation domain-containing protein
MNLITRKNSNAAFTLIESAICLVIIALLVGSAFAAKKVRDNSVLNSIIQDMSKLTFAFNNFKTTYLSPPGDFATAVTNFSNNTTANGNGNGYIDNNSSESVLAMQHLSINGMIEGAYCLNWSISGSCLNYMPSRANIGKDGYYFASTSSTAGANFSVFDNNSNSSYNNIVVYSMLYDTNSNGVYDNWPNEHTYAVIAPNDISMIDNKYDDGIPKTGKIIAADGYNTSSLCLSGNTYISSTNKTCYIATIINN